jgi:hypothetical protein
MYKINESVFQNKQNGGKVEFKRKQNCSKGNELARELFKRSTEFCQKNRQEWNMMFTLRIIAHTSWIKRFKLHVEVSR